MDYKQDNVVIRRLSMPRRGGNGAHDGYWDRLLFWAGDSPSTAFIECFAADIRNGCTVPIALLKTQAST
jgi:hypothetical protein